MNRTDKKCFIASTGVHLVLIGILFVGPGFLSSKTAPPPDEMQLLDFTPLITTDANASGGGDPKGGAPPPPPPERKPPPAPEPKQPEPEPVKQAPEKVKTPDPPPQKEREVKPTREPDAISDDKPHKPKLPDVSTKQEVRKVADKKPNAKSAAAEAEERAARAAEDRRQMALKALNRASTRLAGNFSGGTAIALKGPGGGGLPYANWLQAVKTVYSEAWILPDSVTDNEATTIVSVTVARDGTVIGARIEEHSGNATVDRSVQSALDRVKYVAPLPEESRDARRTVNIGFNVRAKRATG